MGKNLFILLVAAIVAAVLAAVPFFGFVLYGVVIQMLDALAIVLQWEWFDMYHWWNGIISWFLFTLIFFGGYKAYKLYE